MPTVTFNYLSDLYSYINAHVVPNGNQEITGVIMNNATNGLAGFINSAPENWNKATVVTSVATNYTTNDSQCIVIFAGSASGNLTWVDNKWNEWIFINTTNNVRTLASQVYYNQNGASVSSIPAKSIVSIAKGSDNNWYVRQEVSYYHAVQSLGSSLTQRKNLNFNGEFTLSDNSGNDSSDVVINSIAYSKITGISASLPISYSGGVISISQANTSTNGYLSSGDWNTFNNKQAALSGTGFVKISGTTISYDNSTYLTSISGITAGGELSGTYPNPSLLNSAVIGKVLTGLNVTGGSIVSTDSILAAFGKIQNQLNSLTGAVVYQGTWNANTNSPTIVSSTGTKGNYYIVGTAGSTSIDGVSTWLVGDWIIFDGSHWQRIATSNLVTSVNSKVGVVVLTTDDISEGSTNKYWTNPRTINSTLTGYTSGAGTITSSDTLLTAIQKINGNIAALVTGISSILGTSNRISVNTVSGVATIDIAATYVGQTSITTLGTITTGTWNGSRITETYGGTNQNNYTLGDILYASATNTLSKLAGNTTATRNFLRQTGTGSVSAAPVWDTLTKTDVGLSNVDNTSDLSKPISTATSTALALKVNYTDIATTSSLGIVKIGSGLAIDGAGLLSLDTASLSASLRSIQTYTATAGQTVITSVTSLTGAAIDVFVNGVRLNTNSFTSGSTTVTLNDALALNDIVDLVIYRSTLTGVTGITTDGITEGTINLFFTEPRVLGTTLTGFSSTTGTITSSDTILTAIEKLYGNALIGGGGGYYQTVQLNTSSATQRLRLNFSTLFTVTDNSGNNSSDISLVQSNTSTSGYLSSTDWNTFNNKQAALSGTGFVKISGTTISYDNSTYLTTASAASTYVPFSGGTLTGFLTLNADPTSSLHAASKNYVDQLINGLNWKHSVVASTTGTLPSYTVSGGSTILTATANGALPAQDTITLVVGNRLLVKNETSTNQPNNGIYQVTQVGSVGTPWILTRTSDANTSSLLPGSTVYILSGSAEAYRVYSLNVPTITMGTTNITFALISGAGYTNGTGITLTGNVFAIDTTVVATLSGTQTLTNKTIAAGSNTISGLTNSNLSGTAAISNANLANSTISGVSLGSNLTNLTFNNGGSGAASGTTYNGGTAQTISYNTIGAQQALTLTTTGTSGAATLIAGTLNIPQYTGGGGGTTTNAVTFNNSGSGAASGTTFDGSVARTISYNTIGAVPTSTTVAGFALSSNVTLANLTATNSTLTFSGTYNGSTARTIGLNLANANSWTGIQTHTTTGTLNTYPGDAIILENTSLATGISSNQISPGLHFKTQSWPNPGSASVPVEMRMYLTSQSVGQAEAILNLDYSSNGSAWFNFIQFGASTSNNGIPCLSIVSPGNASLNTQGSQVQFQNIGGSHQIVIGDGAVAYASIYTPAGASYVSIRDYSGGGIDRFSVNRTTGATTITGALTCNSTISASLSNVSTSNAVYYNTGTGLFTYATALSGSGTTGTIPIWSSSTGLGNSQIVDNGSVVNVYGSPIATAGIQIGSNASPTSLLISTSSLAAAYGYTTGFSIDGGYSGTTNTVYLSTYATTGGGWYSNMVFQIYDGAGAGLTPVISLSAGGATFNKGATFNTGANVANGSLFVPTMTNVTTANVVYYNTSTGLLTYGAAAGGSSNSQSNITNQTITASSTSVPCFVYICNGTNVVTMPAAASNTIRYTFKINSGTTTILPAGSSKIEGANNLSLSSAGSSIDLISDGTNWFII